jgi:hypothetical protein
MIRLLFVLFVTLGGFAAAALWNARDRDAGDLAERVMTPELRAAAATEIDRLGLPEATARMRAAAEAAVDAANAHTARHPEPVDAPNRAVPDASAAPDPEPPSREARVSSRPPTAPAPSAPAAPPRALARGGAGGSLAPEDPRDPAPAEPAIEEEVLAPRAEFARDFGPASEIGVETTAVLPTNDAPTRASDWEDVAQPHDSDRSARLIRRMLAVYRSTGANR